MSASGNKQIFINSPFTLPSKFSKIKELPDTLRKRVVTTYGEGISEQLNAIELEIAAAIACFDVLVERDAFSSDKYE